MADNKRLFILDGESLLRRAGRRRRKAAGSGPGKTVEAFRRALGRLVEILKPSYFVAVFGSDDEAAAGPSRRDRAAAGRLVADLGGSVLDTRDRRPAEHVAALVRTAAAEGFTSAIISSRKALYQLVDDGTVLIDPARLEWIGPAQVRSRFGVPPARIPDLFVLAGDGSADLAGLPGIGARTAARLLREHGGLEEILTHPDAVSRPRARRQITEHADLLRLNLDLARLDGGVPVPTPVASFHIRPSVTKTSAAVRQPPPPDRYRKATPSVLESMAASPPETVVLYTETSQREARGAELVAAALQVPGKPPLTLACPSMDERRRTLQALRAILEDPAVAKYGHDLKRERLVFADAGIEVSGLTFDSMLAGYLCAPEEPGYSLDRLARRYLPEPKRSYREVLGASCAPGQAPPDRVAEFLAENVAAIGQLHDVLGPQLRRRGLDSHMRHIELPLIDILSDMEHRGLRFDAAALEDAALRTDRAVRTIRQRIIFLAGEDFPPDDNRALRRILFQRLRLSPVRKAGRRAALSDAVLAELAQEHDLPREILELRRTIHLREQVIRPLHAMGSRPDGRLHPHLDLTGTAGGRRHPFGGPWDDPSIPRTVRRQIRRAITAEPGRRLLLVRFPALDLRVLATGVHDTELSRLCDAAADSYGVLARRLNLPDRAAARRLVLGILAGVSRAGVEASGRSADRDSSRFFENFPTLGRQLAENDRRAEADGAVQTVIGRPVALKRRPGHHIAPTLCRVRHSCVDLVKMAAVAVHRSVRDAGLETRLCLPVRNGLLLEAAPRDTERIFGTVCRDIRRALPDGFPLALSAGEGSDMDAAYSTEALRPPPASN